MRNKYQCESDFKADKYQCECEMLNLYWNLKCEIGPVFCIDYESLLNVKLKCINITYIKS